MKYCKIIVRPWALSAICLAVILLIMISCQKDGDLQEAPQVTEVSIKVISSRKAPRFGLFIDDKQLVDGLSSDVTAKRIVVKTEGSQHLVLKEMLSNTILVDTMLELSAPSWALSALESDTTARPLLFVSGESDIAQDSARLAFYVGDPAIPTPVDIYLYKSNLILGTLDTVPIHVYRDLKNYTATDFLTIDMSSDSVGYNILVKRSGTDQLVPNINNNKGVVWDNINSGIRINDLCASRGSGNPTNVHNLQRLGKSGSFYNAACMIFF